jgi:hypothetical protein
MQPEIDPNLERVIHEELRKLPPVKAPEALSARVLATVREQQALPWWHKSIWQWPQAMRTAFLVILAIMVAAMTGSTWWAGDVAAKGVNAFTESTQGLMPLGNAFLVVWKVVLHNIALSLLIFSGMLYLFCLGAGTMFVRFAVRRS